MIRLALLLACVAGAAVAQPAPPDTGGLAFDPHPGARVSLANPLTDDDGRAVRLGEVMAGRPAVLALGYHACPNLCGVVRDDLAVALANAGLRVPEDVSVLSLSVDPAETARDAAGARARVGEAARGWHFLTGEAAPIVAAVGFRSRRDDRLAQLLHPAGLVVLTADGTVSGYLLGVGYDGAALRAAVGRAAAGEVAAAPSPLLLLCFHYDPTTGRYSLDVLRAVQVVAAATAVGLGLWLAATHWPGRRA